MHILAFLTVLLSAADHWTTYLCLRNPIDGWLVTEANPISDWLFQVMGLVPGLLFDSVITVVAVLLLVTTTRVSKYTKGAFFCLVVTTTGYAVINNVGALSALGLSPLGTS